MPRPTIVPYGEQMVPLDPQPYDLDRYDELMDREPEEPEEDTE